MAAVSPARANALLLGVMTFGQLLLMAASVRGSHRGLAGGRGRGRRRPSPRWPPSDPSSGIVQDVVHFFRDIHADDVENARLRLEATRLSGELVADEVARRREHAAATAARHARGAHAEIDRGLRRDRAARRASRACFWSIAARADGVRPDMAVVAWGGAVGRVVGVEREFARVRLLSDPNSGAAGVIARSRAEGMIVGRGAEPLEMIYVPQVRRRRRGRPHRDLGARRRVPPRVRARPRDGHRGARGREQVDPVGAGDRRSLHRRRLDPARAVGHASCWRRTSPRRSHDRPLGRAGHRALAHRGAGVGPFRSRGSRATSRS